MQNVHHHGRCLLAERVGHRAVVAPRHLPAHRQAALSQSEVSTVQLSTNHSSPEVQRVLAADDRGLPAAPPRHLGLGHGGTRAEHGGEGGALGQADQRGRHRDIFGGV